MTTEAIREELHLYVDSADEVALVEMLRFIEDYRSGASDHWEDEEFVAEMERRVQELKDGTVKGVPWEEVKRRTREITN
ncbi:addiction module protein [Mucilaginibacter myungsuensis]|uniref:Addiction module protein n=1 Tax=Mucilaginibacter myungsuensis TaxID=649104 RepID=A0A929KXP4_9SPHI|nr:addiction module protein [Mucilaginibacter myungsuensis]MBE9662368.1 addiction module protein [Mucilaginibacter myungsuensis]MDN3599195.1 addiction module protein [Mucilaginibacter myungsuensis]